MQVELGNYPVRHKAWGSLINKILAEIVENIRKRFDE